MTATLGENVRSYRRRAGYSQEQLAEAAGLSLGTIRKVEQGGTLRMESLHTIARALGLQTSTLLAADAPEPVRSDDPNRLHLIELRKALTPPVGLSARSPEPGEEPSIPALRRAVLDGAKLYHADRYQSVALLLPGLLRDTDRAVEYHSDGEDHASALITRSEAYQVAGRFLTQTRHYDLAYQALASAIADARAAGDTLSAASGVVGLCWLLLRQGRLDDTETLAMTTAEAIEPRMSTATREQLAAWGWLALRGAAGAVRNNRPEDARDHLRMATTAAAAVGVERTDYYRHGVTFGPVTVAMKSVEDAVITGDSRTALRLAEEGPLSAKGRRNAGQPSGDNWNRHRLDLGQAHVLLGDHQNGMDELKQVRAVSPEWLRHQAMARDVMRGILRKRKRTLTADMREMAAYLDVAG
ncbi:helix-turn-helix domain-containing protein [Embleya sp. NPDC050493]|uniref:helix-turn-helix domain-containing protein n=1 Tax=Embleya sp. NPDC050493 TaxID=3363989 RepID=UPI0037A3A2B7